MKDIADLLGHRSIETTFLYTKVDINRLRTLAAEWPEELLSTITFDEYQGKTTLTIEWSPYNAPEKEAKFFEASHASMNQGWGGTLDQLGAYLKEVQ